MSNQHTFEETLYDSYWQGFEVGEVYFEHGTGQQQLKIFHNPRFGRVMVLDGVVQTTEADEFIYHEMLAHVPLLAHGNAKRVLIIGGGDGGILREVCRHQSIEQITQVEIDRAVVEMSIEHLPNHSAGAFDDPRFELVIDDGMNYASNSDRQFDVIISDSTDPIGPGESLFTQDFYSACKARLAPGGILVTQNGVAFMQLDEVQDTARRLRSLFADSTFYSAAVPTYVGGIMTFAWATDNTALRSVDLTTLQTRFEQAGIETRYYNPAIHQAAFALPQYLQKAIAEALDEE
ncbi:MAG: polyamine aminopropyltransferase [Gammaproteobacteria bacterium]|uniref:Polyamine aminopropyltransferase n=1 Tax=Candidatus Thiopontia autotrophica TaxID=2841688 RepID=A0A8J6TSZ5_9GAMM|nr:polyamine aminopropyltransferase [Candidatus Thiopontia autotrophica]MBL6968839.1 polyamine aminopropyltransferase [Gammaproteobacteria bacterium]